MTFNWANLAAPLQGLGQGLMAAGSGGWQNFAPAYNQGMMQQQGIMQDKLDREERARMRQLQEQLLQNQINEQLTANQDAVKQQQAYEKLLGQGMMSPNGMSQAQFGGAPQNQMAPGLMEGFSPEQLSVLRTLPPEAGLGVITDRLFAQPKDRAGVNIGGVLVDPITGAKIADYSDVIRANAAAGRSVTNVQNNMGPTGINYGDPETGLAWRRNPDGSVMLDDKGLPMAAPYQGSKAFVEAQSVSDAKSTKAAETQKTADIVSEDIGRVFDTIDQSTLPTTGFVGSMLSNVGGTAANDVRALVDTIQANVGFDKLQAMRASSPTGGALGSITERELALLSSVLGNLEQSQSEQQIKENLARLEEVYLDIIHGPGNRPEGWQPRNTGEKKRLKYNPATGELE